MRLEVRPPPHVLRFSRWLKWPGWQPIAAELLELGRTAAKVLSSAKADALRKLLEAQAQSAGKKSKVIVFTQFRSTLEMLATQLKALEG